MVLSDVVLSDVDVKHSEAEVSSELAVQGFETASVTRFHRTARGKPPKALPLVRVSLEEEAASRLLAAGGVHLFRVCCAAGRPKSDRDSASAKGWSADSNQHRGRKVEQAVPRTAAAAVEPLQGVPYAEQLQRKRDAMRAALAQLPALLWQEAAHVGAAQLPAWHGLGWLRAEALERHGGAPCEVEAVVWRRRRKWGGSEVVWGVQRWCSNGGRAVATVVGWSWPAGGAPSAQLARS